MQELAVMAMDRPCLAVLAWPSAFGGGDDAADAEVSATVTVKAFGLVAGVAQEGGELLSLPGLVEDRLALGGVGPGAAIDDQAQDQVAAGVAQGRQLGITGFVVGPVPLAAAGEVVGDVARLQTGGVDGRQAADGRDQALATGLVNDGVEESREGVLFRKRSSA